MSGAEAMTAFTPEADARLTSYLRQVRAALAAAPDVDPAEVEADIREHVDAEFAGKNGPVGLAELEAVLTRLGPPTAWAGGAVDGRPIREQFVSGAKAVRDGLRQTARGVIDVLWRGPEDWRLAYLTFGVFVMFVFSLPDLRYRPWPFMLLAVAYLLGRAAYSVAAEKGVRLGARRWLVYPPLVLVSLPLLIGVVALPLAAGVTAGRVTAEVVEESKRWPTRGPGDGHFVREVFPGLSNVKPIQTGVLVGVGVAAMGYAVLGMLTAAFPGVPRAVCVPFLASADGRHGRRLFLAAFAVLVVWGVVAYPLLERVTTGPGVPDSPPPVTPTTPRQVGTAIQPRIANPPTRRVSPPRPPNVGTPVTPDFGWAIPSLSPEVLPSPRPAGRR